MKKNNLKIAKKLANRDYITKTYQDETTDGDFIFLASNLELEGCLGQGFTIEEAIDDLFDARVDYIKSLLDDNLPVPDPIVLNVTDFSTGTCVYYFQHDADNIQVHGSPEVSLQYSKRLISATC